MIRRLILFLFAFCGVALAQYTARGAWSSVTAYVAYDTVTLAGNTYVAVSSSTNVTPGTDSPAGSKWALVAVSIIPDETPAVTWARWNGAFAALSLFKAPLASPTFTGTVTTPITGSTQCLHVNSSGVLSGTGVDCGAGASTGDAAGYTTVTFSATPTFSVTKNTGQAFLLTLTGNITSSTLDTSGITGSGRTILAFRFCQDVTGSRTVVWPTNVLGHGTIDSTASGCSNQVFWWDGTNAQALGPMTTTGVSVDFIVIPGSTSGSTKLQASAVASGTAVLPAAGGTLMSTADAVVKVQTPLTTKGDIWVTDGTSMHRLAAGSNTQVLTADSAQTDGVKWAPPSGGGSAVAHPVPMTARCNSGGFDWGNFNSTAGSWIGYCGTFAPGGATSFPLVSSDNNDSVTTFMIEIPAGFTRFDIHVKGYTEATTANALTWTGKLGCMADASAKGSLTYNAGTAVTASSTTANTMKYFLLNSLDITSCPTGSLLYAVLTRSGTYVNEYRVSSIDFIPWY